MHPDVEAEEEIDGAQLKLPPDLEPEWSLGRLYDAFKAVADIERGAEKLPFKLAWQVDDLLTLFKPYAIKFETRQQELLKRFGKQAAPNPNLAPGQVAYTIEDPEAFKAYQETSRELSRAVPSDFKESHIKPISVKELEKAEGLQISPETVRTLRYLGLVAV